MRKVASSICRRFQYNMLRKIAADYETGTTPAPGEEDGWVNLPGGGRVRDYQYTGDDMLDEESIESTKRVLQNATDPKIRQKAQRYIDWTDAAIKHGVKPGTGTRHVVWGDQYLNPPAQTATNPPQMSPEEAFGPRPSYVEHAPYNPQQLAQAQAPAPPQAPAPSVPPARPDMKSIAPSFAQKTTADRPGAAARRPGVGEAVPGSTNGGSGVWSKIRGAAQRGAEYAVNPGAAVRDIGRVGTAIGKKILNAAGDGAVLRANNSYTRR